MGHLWDIPHFVVIDINWPETSEVESRENIVPLTLSLNFCSNIFNLEREAEKALFILPTPTKHLLHEYICNPFSFLFIVFG